MIENELKYVLKLDAEEVVAIHTGQALKNIKQGYLPGGGRLRSSQGHGFGERYTFNYKVPLDTGESIEFEVDTTEDMFNLAWKYCGKTLTKRRYFYNDFIAPAITMCWDIDFFEVGDSENGVYFAMAECEMRPGLLRPPRIPDWLEPLIVYSVPRHMTSEFSSAQLADPDYAAWVLDRLRLGTLPKDNV